ncbi:MAG: hypothetical protein ACREU2_10145 [Steroidobacteraceae bacterium]
MPTSRTRNPSAQMTQARERSHRRGTLLRRIANLLTTLSCTTLLAPLAGAATPTWRLALRPGTTRIGLDYDIALGHRFSARIGYGGFTYGYSVNTPDVDYNGTLKLSILSGLVNRYVFNEISSLINSNKHRIWSGVEPSGRRPLSDHLRS